MIETARELGLQVMVGCMTESTVGISAIAQLLPLLDYVDMDGAVLLREDIATGVTLEQGRCDLSGDARARRAAAESRPFTAGWNVRNRECPDAAGPTGRSAGRS